MPYHPGRTTFTVPYGRESLTFTIPPTMTAAEVDPLPFPTIPDLAKAAREALESPVGSPRLREMARPTDQVCIVVTDATRDCPDSYLVPGLIEELERAGVKPENITLLVGVGMHRPSTPEERLEKLGADIVGRFRIIDHNAQDPAGIVQLGTNESGIPLSVSKLAYESDLLIATGIVEPHQYAGFSGGGKTVTIGAGGEVTITHTHGPAMVDHPKTRLGNLEGNLFRQAVNQVAEAAGLRFIINVVMNDQKQPVAVRAGHPIAAFNELVEIAKKLFTVPIPKAFDVAVGGIGYPKDANLYQASRAASYLHFAPEPVIKPGGLIVLPARCQEGPGQGKGEQNFYHALKNATSLQAFLEESRRVGYPAGEQRAFVMAKVLEYCDVVVVGSECPDIVRDLKMIPLPTMEEAFKLVEERIGKKAEVLVVPHALLTLPVIAREAIGAR